MKQRKYSLRYADADTKAALIAIAIAIAIVVYGGCALAIVLHAGDL